MADELIDHLVRLRERAGNPSYRDLARLTERQGARSAMARSTIADKLKGNPPLNAGHILILVRAIGDYAEECGHPLLSEELESELWRSRIEAAGQSASPSLKSQGLGVPHEDAAVSSQGGHGRAPVPNSAVEAKTIPVMPAEGWDLEPLALAGMEDIVSWIEENEHKPFAEWMPRVLDALEISGMSDMQFVLAAGRQAPGEVCDLLDALGQGQESKKVIASLASQCSAENLPKAIVALRRFPEVWIREASSGVLDCLAKGRGWDSGSIPVGRRDFRAIYDALNRANLKNDANYLIDGLAKFRFGAEIVNAALSFPSGDPWDPRCTLLSKLWEGGSFRITSTVKVIRDAERLSKKTKDELLEIITTSIPNSQQQQVRHALEKAGIIQELPDLKVWPDEPPF